VSPLEFFDPPLTAVRQSVAQMGRRGVELLVEERSNPARMIVDRLPVELIRRASVAPPRR
jgi:LacI family transcriptional regulator